MDDPDPEVNIERKALIYQVELVEVLFNTIGRYFIKLTLQKLQISHYPRVKVQREGDQLVVEDHEATSEILHQSEDIERACHFTEGRFTFYLPKGFCRNEKDSDVILNVEAISLPEDDKDVGKTVGQAKVAIYPRIDSQSRPATARNIVPSPRLNYPGEIYHYTNTAALLRTESTESIFMHCGQLKYTATLTEDKNRTPTPAKTSSPADLSHNDTLPKMFPSPPPSTAASRRSPSTATSRRSLLQVPESPKPREELSPHMRHVSKPGKEEITVMFHGAANLPSAIDGKIPTAFASVKSKSDSTHMRKAQGVTYSAMNSSHSPYWEQVVAMEINEDEADDEAIILSVADNPTKQELVSYNLPVSFLTPFHQYHLELVMPAKKMISGIRTFVTVTRKSSTLPRELSSPSYCALEVFLQGFEKPLLNPVGNLIAVARLVPNYQHYKKEMLVRQPRDAGITLNTVTFPSPHRATFSVAPQQSQGFPQVTLPSTVEEQPEWYHPYLFSQSRDNATLFTPGAALVFEYYISNSAMTDLSWRVRNPIGFSTLLLDEKIYKQLNSERARQGAQVKGLPVQGSNLKFADRTLPTVGLVLRLITTERPDSLAATRNHSKLPVVQIESHDNTRDQLVSGNADILTISPNEDIHQPADLYRSSEVFQPKTYQTLENEPQLSLQKIPKGLLSPFRDGEFPPPDAMETILPEYQYIFVDPDAQKRIRQPRPTESPTRDRYLTPDDLEQKDIVEDQLNELDSYRVALQKMGQDLLTLRQQLREVEDANSKLRRDLASYGDATKLLLDSPDLDNLSKDDICLRYVTIKQKLAKQTNEHKDYKEKVQRLQNELIKKNDKEREYLQMNQAHNTQQSIVHKLQDKVQKIKKLEEACRQQEKVIEKMEKILNTKLREKGSHKDSSSMDVNDALMSENKRLRHDIAELNDSQRTRHRSDTKDELEKLELYQALDKAEGRIMSLEKQLADNSRQWGKERAGLQLKLNEAQHGFGRSNSIVLHDFPLTSTDRKYDYPESDSRRYSKAPGRRYGSPKLDPIRYK